MEKVNTDCIPFTGFPMKRPEMQIETPAPNPFQPVAEEIKERGFYAAETEIVLRNVGRGEMECLGVALFGQTVDDRSSGIAEIHDFCSLVNGFSSGVVDGAAHDLHVKMASEQEYLGVAAAYKQTHERELGRSGWILGVKYEMG